MTKNGDKHTILIAPLDWGLGHTTRCMVLINILQSNGYEIIFAGNSTQQQLIAAYFSNNINYENLEGYNVKYSKKKWWLPFKILMQLPKICFAVYKENRWLQNILRKRKISLVISDNRYGLFSSKIPCVFLTHQLQILVPFKWLAFVVRKLNYAFINKFDLLLIPDVETIFNIACKLSHPLDMPKTKAVYLGILSRFLHFNTIEDQELKSDFDLCIILSGPEPQRSILEVKLLNQLKKVKANNIVFVRGMPNCNKTIEPQQKNLVIYNHLQQHDLYSILNSSKIILSRSGYTTLMEVLPLQKKLILIPTPGQTEQEYLATHLDSLNLAISSSQENLNLSDLLEKAISFKPSDFNFNCINEAVFLNEIESLL